MAGLLTAAFTGGQPSDMSNIVGHILAGRSREVRGELFARINDAWTAITGLPAERLKITLFEVPLASIMQGGRMMSDPTPVASSVLVVRRSTLVPAPPERVWREFESIARMQQWWGVRLGVPEAGKSNGQRLITYEPRLGGRIEMEVVFDGVPTRYGGPIVTFEPGRELTFENDWIPNRGWLRPTRVTIRLTPLLDGTLVELMHHGFEFTGGDFREEHAGYEAGWGMTQLNALRQILGRTS